MQQTLTETKIKIIPSKTLIDVINLIESPTNLTNGLYRFHRKFKKIHNDLVKQKMPFVTKDEEIEYIETLRKENDIELEPKSFVNLNLQQKVNSGRGKSYLELEDLKCLKEHLPSGTYLHEILKDCTICVPQNEIIERDEELERRCIELRARQKNIEYRAMTRNVDNFRAKLPEDTIAFQVKEINKQLIAVAQFIMSVLAGFAFGFLGVELAVGHLDFGFRLLLGIICALIIALAEIYFLAKKLNEYSAFLDRARTDDGMVPGAANRTNAGDGAVKSHTD